MTQKSLALALLTALLALPLAAEEMTVDDVIAHNIETRGGMDAFEGTKTLKVTGTMNMGGGMEAPLTIYIKRPDKMRLEFEIQGMTAVQAIDGDSGWSLMPFMGQTEPQPMADDQLTQSKEMADIDGPLVDYEKKGHTIEYLGTEEVDGTPAHKLRVTMASGDEVISYLDTDHFLEFKQERTVDVQGTETKMFVEYGDYKEVGPLVLFHSIQQTMEGAPAGQSITFDTVERNIEVDDSLFEMPAAEAAAPATGG